MLITLTFNLDNIEKIDLCLLPTPIVLLNRLSDHLGGPKIYMKRDDLTGIAFGGNKNRKLEYIMADAVRKGSDIILTEGAINSNHCLQTAACAAKLGLKCEIILSGEIPEEITGNYLLFQILGITIHIVNEKEERTEKMKKRAEELILEGKKPYIVPTGGSTAIGALGYINCMSEVAKQSKEMKINFDYFIHAAGSSGTQAGMLIGKELFAPDIDIISISGGMDIEELSNESKSIINEFNAIYNVLKSTSNISTKVVGGYEGPGYGLASKEMAETVKRVAQLEGVFLDPVYNGKAMVGLIDMVKSKKFSKDQNILFLHSGGGPSIFDFKNSFIT